MVLDPELMTAMSTDPSLFRSPAAIEMGTLLHLSVSPCGEVRELCAERHWDKDHGHKKSHKGGHKNRHKSGFSQDRGKP